MPDLELAKGKLTIDLNGHKVCGAAVKGTFAWAEPYFCPGIGGGCTATWVFTPEEDGKYAVVTGTVDRRSLIRTARLHWTAWWPACTTWWWAVLFCSRKVKRKPPGGRFPFFTFFCSRG